MTTLPSVLECKSLADVHEQSAAITKMATDLVNEPIVQQGYMTSGQVPATVFINVASMARKRLGGIFPAANWKDPLYERLMAEAKLICAECIHLKYECRARRQPYDHLNDATIRIKKMVRDAFKNYYDHIKLLEAANDSSQSPASSNEQPG